MNKNERVGRYSLILETIDGNKYYYDTDLATFVMLHNKMTAKKTQLEKLDFLTANYDSKEQFVDCYSISSPVKSLYITYQFKGENRLAPIFDNKEWAELAKSYTGKEVDFRIHNNYDIFNKVYLEIAKVDSPYAEALLKNVKRLITISPQTKDIIVCLRAHERAIRDRRNYSPFKDFYTEVSISNIYSEDRYGFYKSLQKRLSNYRELRTLYMNYCRFEQKRIANQQLKEDGKQNEISGPALTKKIDNPSLQEQKKPIVPPQQLSMFDL